MIMFWVAVSLMILIAIAILSPALIGKNKRLDENREEQNIAIAKEQLRLLEAEKAAGKIPESSYEQTRLEIERALHHDVADNQVEVEIKDSGDAKPKVAWLGLLLLIPLLAVPLYSHLGSVGLVDPSNVEHMQSQAQSAPNQMDLFAAASGLAKKMEENPDDPKGWLLLGQTYMALQEYPKAVEAFANSYRLDDTNPALMLRYADALAMTSNSSMNGLPFELVKKAVKLVPSNPTALWMVGMGYAESGDFEKALYYWNLLLPLVASDPTSKGEVEKLILAASERLGKEVPTQLSSAAAVEKSPTSVKKASVQLEVSVSETMRSQVSPEDIVFIFARATKGPRIPLAAVRKQVKDLPVTITLDDSTAMRPEFRLSSFPEVLVGARISRSGNPIASAGDFYGEQSPVVPANMPELKIEINKVVQ